MLCGDANDWHDVDPEDVDVMVYDPEWDDAFTWDPQRRPTPLNTLAFTPRRHRPNVRTAHMGFHVGHSLAVARRQTTTTEQHPQYVDVIRARWHGLADLAGIDPGPDALDPAVHFPGVDLRIDHDLARTATTATPRKRHTSKGGNT